MVLSKLPHDSFDDEHLKQLDEDSKRTGGKNVQDRGKKVVKIDGKQGCKLAWSADLYLHRLANNAHRKMGGGVKSRREERRE